MILLAWFSIGERESGWNRVAVASQAPWSLFKSSGRGILSIEGLPLVKVDGKRDLN